MSMAIFCVRDTVEVRELREGRVVGYMEVDHFGGGFVCLEDEMERLHQFVLLSDVWMRVAVAEKGKSARPLYGSNSLKYSLKVIC